MRSIVNLRFAVLAFVALPAAAAASDKLIPLDVAGPRPTAQLTIQEHPPVTVIFDTGAGGSVINADYAKTIGLPNEGEAAVGSPGGQKAHCRLSHDPAVGAPRRGGHHRRQGRGR